ncbi:hypothetical protein [Aliiroseovarius sp. 2305UL8-7]|uniref:hypothetical protein n=1 Tax=Aliiroseovarius conchicola TaxID=3121637 RepID=UPI0035276A66
MQNIYKLSSATAVLLVVSTPVFAVDLVGVDVTLGYGAVTGSEDLSTAALTGSVEIGFGSDFGLQLDLSGYSNNNSLGSSKSLSGTMHALYHVNQDITVSAFYGANSLTSGPVAFYGAEADITFGNITAEVYWTQFSDQDFIFANYSSRQRGAEVKVELSPKVSLGVSYDQENADLMMKSKFLPDAGYSTKNFAMVLHYRPTEHVSLLAKVGQSKYDGTGSISGLSQSDVFYGLGIEYTFGKNKGTTFGTRGRLWSTNF